MTLKKLLIYDEVLVVISVLGDYIWWYVRYKPLRDGALQLINEIEKELFEE